MFTRRRFLVLFPAFATAAHSFASLPLRKKKVPPAPVFVYFGTDTSKGVGKGIYHTRFADFSVHCQISCLQAGKCVRE